MARIGDFLGRLVYETSVDSGGVDKGLTTTEKKVEAALKRLDAQDATIELKADQKDLDLGIKEARKKLDSLEKEEAEIRVTLGDAEFEAQVKKVRAQIAALSRQRAEIEVRIDEKGLLSKDARRVATDLGRVEDGVTSVARKIGAARANIGPFTLTLKSLVPVLATLAPLLVHVGAGIVAVAGSLTEAAAGGIALATAGFAGLATSAAGAFFALKPMITSLSTMTTASKAAATATAQYGASSDEAKTATKKLDETISALPPHIQEVVNAWGDLKADFAKRTGSIQDNAASVMANAIKTADDLLPTFARNSRETFKVAADGVNDWLEGLRSAEADNLLDNIMGNFRRGLPDLLHGLGQFATALSRIASVASDFLPEFLKGFDRVGTDFAQATDNGRRLHRTIGGLMEQTHSWFRLIGATGRLLTTVLTGGADAGKSAVDDLTRSINDWNKSLSSDKGRKNMQQFFAESIHQTEEFISLVGKLTTFLFNIGRATAPLAEGFLAFAQAAGDVGNFIVQLQALRTPLKIIGIGIAALWATSKITSWYATAQQALIRIGILSAETGRVSAGSFMSKFGGTLGPAAAALGVGNILSSALEGDAKQAGFKTGGAIIGGIAGALGGPGGILIGTGVGSVVGGLVGTLFGGVGQKVHKLTEQSILRPLEQAIKKGGAGLNQAAKELAKGDHEIARAHDKASEAAKRVNRLEDKVRKDRQKFGPADDKTLRDERRLVDARHDSVRAIHAENRAERKHGLEKKAFADKLRHQLSQERAQIVVLRKNAREQEDNYRHLRKTEGQTGKTRAAGDKWTHTLQELRKAGEKQNRTLAQGANLLGQKTTKRIAEAAKNTGTYRARVLQLDKALHNQIVSGRNNADTMKALAKGTDILGRDFQSTREAAKTLVHAGIDPLHSRSDQAKTSVSNFGDTLFQVSRGPLPKMQQETKTVTERLTDVQQKAPDTASSVTSSMNRSKQGVHSATESINKDLEAQLKKFGADLQGGSGVQKQKGGKVDEQRKAGGGFTVPGMGDGDRYSTVLPAGSYVLNRNAARAAGFGPTAPPYARGGAVPVRLEAGERVFGPDQVTPQLQALNSMVPRFAKGGGVVSGAKPIELLWQVEGHYDHLHVAYQDTDTTHAVGNAVKKMGYTVGENPLFFPPYTASVHDPGGYHPTGQAFDVNDDAAPFVFGGGEVSSLSHLFELLSNGKISGAAATGSIKLDRYKSTRPSTKGAVAGLNLVAAAAEKFGNSKLGGVGGFAGITGGSIEQLAHNMVEAAWGETQWPPFKALEEHEDAWDPHSQNPNSSAYGIAQNISPSTYPPAGRPGSTAPLMEQAKAQLTWMINYIKGRYGTPSVAWAGWGGGNLGVPGYQGGGQVPTSGGQGGGGGHGLPGHQVVKLPPKPDHPRKKDFGTGPTSWYDWFGRAIDFYDSRGDLRSDAGKVGKAKEDWRVALRDIINEEDQIKRIIKHDKGRMAKIRHTDMPKRLKKSEPDKHFKFRDRKKGEKQDDYHDEKKKARKEWKAKRKAWEKEVRDWKKQIKARKQGIKDQLPDLYQQMRVDLPTRYNEIQEKISGQAADKALEQTAFGQERYQALLEFGGNFSGGMMDIGSAASRYGITARSSGSSNLPAALAAARNIPPQPSGATTGPAGAGGTTTTKVVNVTNNYQTMPPDPHTWSASLNYELGALG